MKSCEPFDEEAQTEITRKPGKSSLFALFHSFPDVFFVISPTGTILDANQAFADRFHKTPEEFCGLNVFDFLPQEVVAERMTMVREAVRTAKVVTFDDESNGQLTRSTIYPYKSAEGNVDRLLILAQDITDVEQLLKKEQFFNKQIINAIPGNFYLLDANGKFVAWNEQFCKNRSGVSEDEMIGTIGLEAIHPDDRSRALETLQNVIQNGTETTQEFRVVRRGGSALEWRLMTDKRIMIDGAPFLIGVSIDITDRKHAEEALLKSEERFRTLFNSSSAIQALLDPDTGKVLDVNQTAAEWYVWSVDELKQMFTRDVNTLSQAEIEKSLQTVDAREHNKFIGQHRRADGSIRDVEIFRNKIEIDGKPVIHAIIHDITERKLAEKELERLNRVLMVSDQCNKALIHAQDERELLQKICRIIVDIGGYRMAWVGYALDDETKSLHPATSAGSIGDYFDSTTISWADDQYGQEPAGSAIRTGKTVSVNHILTNSQFDLWRPPAIKNGYAAALGLPLSIDNHVVGALTIYSELPDAFNAAETLQLTSLADNLAFGIKMLRQSDALKKSEMRFRKLFERNAAIKLLLDPENGNIIDANPAASNFYGWSVDELRRMNIAQINSAIQLKFVKNNLAKVINEGHASSSFRHVMKDGSVRDVNVLSTKINDGNKDLINAIIYDVTENKRYEQINALRLHILQIADTHSVEDLLMATLDEAEKLTGSEIGFVFFVAEDQNTLLLQAVSTNTFENVCKAEGKGVHYPLDKAGVWADAVRAKKAIIHNDYLSLKHRTGMPEGIAEIRRELVIPVNRDGKIVAIMGVGNKQSDYDDKDIAYMELIANHTWDIVAKKIADEEKKMLADQLQQSMKMEMIGQLSAGIAHEINNPLNYITLNEYNLKDDFDDLCLLVGQYRRLIGNFIAGKAETREVEQLREKEREFDIDQLLKSIPESLENSKSGIQRITAITRSMKSYSFKNASEQLFRFDLNKAIHEAVVIAKHEYSKIATVGLQLEELPQLLCNPPQISQVILNLIINSSHAIKSQNRESPGKIEIKTWATDEGVFCSVTDDGPGIPESVINKVFEPFFTTKEPGKGTGLGLSVSYDIIVNKHKGSLSAVSLPEGGTVFTFSLPVTKVLSV